MFTDCVRLTSETLRMLNNLFSTSLTKNVHFKFTFCNELK